MHKKLLLILFFIPAYTFSGNLEAHLVLIGPGKPLYTHWGHIGISLKDKSTGKDLFYDFGNFSFHSPNFYNNFIRGYMLYSSDVKPTMQFIERCRKENSEIILYPLNLSDEALSRLQYRLNWWVLKENREYLYHYFNNNCSTIIRDILDEVSDGQIKASSSLIENRTYRYYARSGSSRILIAEILIHFVLGPSSDKPINGWELMFLPYELADFIEGFVYVDENGLSRPFTGQKKILKENTSSTKKSRPHVLWPLLFFAGMITAVAWCFFDGKRFGSWIQTIIILVPSFPGLVLTNFMLFTNHSIVFGNANIWPGLPTLLLALIPLHFRAIPRRRGIIAGIWTINLIGLIVVIFLRISGVIVQDTEAFWCFFAPLSFAASWPGLLLRNMIAGNMIFRVRGLYFNWPIRLKFGRVRFGRYSSRIRVRRGKF